MKAGRLTHHHQPTRNSPINAYLLGPLTLPSMDYVLGELNDNLGLKTVLDSNPPSGAVLDRPVTAPGYSPPATSAPTHGHFHTHPNMSHIRTPDGVTPLPPFPRPNESQDTLRARWVYQSRKRGTLESGLLLSTFTRDQLADMSVEEMREYDKVCICCFSVSPPFFLKPFSNAGLTTAFISSWTTRIGISTTALLLGNELACAT